MLRIVKLAIVGAITLSVWAYILSLELSDSTRTFVLLLPLLAVFAFGLCLLVALAFGVLQFKTVPQEAELLQEDIQRARRALKSKGISID